MNTNHTEAADLAHDWATNPRWAGVTRPYTPEDVLRLRGSVPIAYTLASRGAERLWQLLQSEPYVATLGALTGNQAVQQVRAGLQAIYLSGWQVAADANLAGQMYPDQSLYPANSVPAGGARASTTRLQRADQIDHAEGRRDADWFAPIVADGEAGFGGPLNVFELTKAMIEAGAAGVHFEDQLASREEVRAPGRQSAGPDRAVHPQPGRGAAGGRRAGRAHLAASPAPTPTAATLLTSDIDERDQRVPAPASARRRASSGSSGGLDAAIARGLAYAPYADLLWCETSEPDLAEARRFAEAIHAKYPGQAAGLQLLALVQLEEEARRRDDRPLPAGAGRDGLQVPVRHAGRVPRAQLLHVRAGAGLPGARHGRLLASCSRPSSPARPQGYTATQHQREVGTGYFDEVAQVIAGGESSTTALAGSTEAAQFH